MATTKRQTHLLEKEQQQGKQAPCTGEEVEQITKQGTEDYNSIAAAVTHLLKPMIQEAVETAMQAGLDKIRADLATNTTRIRETEQRISHVEDEQTDQLTRYN